MLAPSALPAEPRRPALRAAVATGRVRRLDPADLPALVTLYLRVYGPLPVGGSAAATRYLARLLFEHPWQADDLPSLVFEGPGGEPAGLIGVMPRLVDRGGETLRLAIGHHFMVAPEVRSTLASVQLMRAFLSGPQDVAILDGCAPGRWLWEALGGSAAVIPGLRWLHVFAPCSAAVGLAARRWPVAAWLGGAARLGDRLAARIAPRFRPRPAPGLSAEPLDAARFASVVASMPRRGPRPVLDDQAAAWLLDHLAAKTHRGQLHGAVLRRENGALAGWYLYYLKPIGLSHVVALQATPDQLEAVYDHLVAHARVRGAGALAGQMDKNLLGVGCISTGLIRQPADSWHLVHSLRPELLHDLHSGQFSLSRLESDWWMAY